MKDGQRFNPFRIFAGVFVPEALCKLQDLSSQAKLIYGRLCRYAGEKGEAYPAIPTLGEEVGLKPTQCREHLHSLIEYGLVETEERPGFSTVYHFVWRSRVFENPSGNPEGGESRTSGNPDHTPPETRTTPLRVSGDEESHIRESERESVPIDPDSGEELKPKTPSRFPQRKKQKFVDPNSTSERMRRMRENPVSEPANGFHVTNGVFPKQVVPDATKGTVAPNWAALWNERIPEMKADPKLRMNLHGFRDSAFQERFDEICKKAKKMVRKGAEIKLGWLITKDDKNGMYRWEQMLNGDLEWMLKKIETEKEKVGDYERMKTYGEGPTN